MDNGAALCRHHHDWVHANSRVARERFGLAGHATDVVSRGRVVGPRGYHADLIILDEPFAEERAALRAARPRRTE